MAAGCDMSTLSIDRAEGEVRCMRGEGGDVGNVLEVANERLGTVEQRCRYKSREKSRNLTRTLVAELLSTGAIWA